jgi:ABC-2 type transport system permease protein
VSFPTTRRRGCWLCQRRAAIVAAKFVVVGMWAAGLTALVLVLGLIVGAAAGLPGWSPALLWRAAGAQVVTAGLTLALMTPVALLASAGCSYLPPLGWAFLTFFLAQILSAIGWGGVVSVGRTGAV